MNRKEELLINAAKIIQEEGIQKLTIAYLAKKSKITKAGVLYHFDNKENLLLQMNKQAIEMFEQTLHHYTSRLSGASRFTRAYAYTTLDFFKSPETTLLPAVLTSSLEYDESYQLWEETLTNWEKKFQTDSGHPEKNLQLRLICDGIWFSILYGPKDSFDPTIETLVLNYCEALEKEHA